MGAHARHGIVAHGILAYSDLLRGTLVRPADPEVRLSCSTVLHMRMRLHLYSATCDSAIFLIFYSYFPWITTAVRAADAFLTVYLAIFLIERRPVVKMAERIPGLHRSNGKQHWFWGSMQDPQPDGCTSMADAMGKGELFTSWTLQNQEKFGEVVCVSPPLFSKLCRVVLTNPKDIKYVPREHMRYDVIQCGKPDTPLITYLPLCCLP